jgi:hypothetical protein
MQRCPTIVVAYAHVCPSSKQQNSAIAIVHADATVLHRALFKTVHVCASVEEPTQRNLILAFRSKAMHVRPSLRASKSMPQTLTSMSNTSCSQSVTRGRVQRRAATGIAKLAHNRRHDRLAPGWQPCSSQRTHTSQPTDIA